MTTHVQKNSVRADVGQAGAVPFDSGTCITKTMRLIAEAAGREEFRV